MNHRPHQIKLFKTNELIIPRFRSISQLWLKEGVTKDRGVGFKGDDEAAKKSKMNFSLNFSGVCNTRKIVSNIFFFFGDKFQLRSVVIFVI